MSAATSGGNGHGIRGRGNLRGGERHTILNELVQAGEGNLFGVHESGLR